jgi:hypothetical protein
MNDTACLDGFDSGNYYLDMDENDELEFECKIPLRSDFVDMD